MCQFMYPPKGKDCGQRQKSNRLRYWGDTESLVELYYSPLFKKKKKNIQKLGDFSCFAMYILG